MKIRKQTLALGLALALGASGTGIALAQSMPNNPSNQVSGMMSGSQGGMGRGMTEGMMGGGQGSQRPDMMSGGHGGQGTGMMSGGQGGQGTGMMGGGQGGHGPGMMGGSQGGMGMMGSGMMPCPMMSANGMGMMQQMLEPDQREAMRELMQEHRPAQFERMGRMMNLRDDLMAEMHQDRPDPAAVQERHSNMAELHGEMMAEMVRMRNAMHDLMTDEQREQLRQAGPAKIDPEGHDGPR